MKQVFFVLISTVLGCNTAITAEAASFHRIASLQGGYASINAGNNTQRFNGTDSDVFTYISTEHAKNSGFVGVFLGAEHPLSINRMPKLLVQSGFEYNYFGKIVINGVNTVGSEPSTLTTYRYNYNFQTQQTLGVIKLLATTHNRYHPYGEVGLGAAFNQTQDYNTTTADTGSLNLTMGFNDNNQTRFSYVLGLGVDTEINTNLRMGLGYRYSNFGSVSFNKGMVSLNTYQAPTSFSLSNPTLYTNQLVARVSYLT